MGFLNYMAKQKNLLKRLASAFKASSDNDSKTPYIPAGYEASSYGFDSYNSKQSVYLKEMKGWVAACVNSISDEVAKLELKLYKKTKDGVEEIEKHDVLDVLYKVNEFTTKFDHFWLTQAYLELTGESPWFLEREGGKVTGIYFLSPDKITPITGDGKLIAGYKYRIGGGKEVILTPEEVIFLKYPNPAKPFRGLGTLEEAARVVDIDNYSEEWNKKFYENSARPDAVLTVGVENMDSQQKDELKTSISKQYKGVKNAHNLMVLFGDMEFSKSGLSQKDMDFLEQQKFSRDKLLGIFRVPKAIVSQTEGVNFASAKTAQYIFARYTIKPKMERLIQQLNEFLLPLFPGTEEMFLDFESPVPEDEETQAKIWAEGIKAGYLTINEVRRQQGLPDVEGGDAIYLPLNVAPIGEGGGEEGEGKVKNVLPVKKESGEAKAKRLFSGRIRETNARSKEYIKETEDKEQTRKDIYAQVKAGIYKAYKKNEDDEKREAIPRRKMSKEEVDTYWKLKNNLFKSYSEKVVDEMIKIFRKQRRETLPKFDKYTKGLKLDSTEIYNSVKLNTKEETNKTVLATLPIFSELFKEAGDEAFKLVGSDMVVDLTSEETQKYLNKSSRKFAKGVTETTNSNIKKQIALGFANNENMYEIKERVKTVFVDAEDSRALMISRSETLRYNTHASEQAFKDSGLVEGKKWVTNPNPCSECAVLEGATVGLNDNFLDKGGSINGVVFDYEDISAPPLHPSCECDLIPIFKPIK